jgi:hypothetical protein
MTLSVRRSSQRRLGLGQATSNFFRAIYLQADQEQRVELINNYLQLLWRAGTTAGLTTHDPVMQQLDMTLGQWGAWKQQYSDAVLRRWVPFTRAWGDELNDWSERVEKLQDTLDSATSGQVSKVLAQQGLDPSAIKPDAPSQALDAVIKRLGQILRSPLFWPVVGVIGTLIVAGWGLKLYRGFREAT